MTAQEALTILSNFNCCDCKNYSYSFDECMVGKHCHEAVDTAVNALNAVEALTHFIVDAPCTYGHLDGYTDDWCEAHCGNVSNYECWKHAIEAGWIG